jgi:Fur family ferric uptake transcriptional regulator
MTDQLKELGKAIQQKGFKLTRSRRQILAALISSQGHITADSLYESLNQEQSGIGRMSVYRTLDLLSELGLIRPVYQGTGAAQYILLDNGHHHHLVCSQCGTFIELNSCVVKKVEKSISRDYNFEIQGHLLEFIGRCADCQEVIG